MDYDNTAKMIISYLESTPEDSWCTDVVRTEDGKNCLFGHIFAIGKDDTEGNRLWEWFRIDILIMQVDLLLYTVP